jgi:hypothetical protein
MYPNLVNQMQDTRLVVKNYVGLHFLNLLFQLEKLGELAHLHYKLRLLGEALYFYAQQYLSIHREFVLVQLGF